MARLAVNVDHVATVREARKAPFPDPVEAAVRCERAGCNGIVVHLREDRRHIKERDVRLLKETVKTKLNLEMATTEPMVEIAKEIKPHWICLVPERPEEVTTEGGLHLIHVADRVREVIPQLKDIGIKVTVFIEPEEKIVRKASELGADAIEINTGGYADATGEEHNLQLERVRKGAKLGKELGLEMHAGHGLHYENVRQISEIDEIEELSIGHSIVARAILVGLESAVKEMLELVKGRAPSP